MRVDGSLKTVTAGVTSLDDKRHNGTYAKTVDNWRCDPMQGLVKRPASIYIAETIGQAFNPLTDAVFSTIILDTLYWVFILPGQGDGGSHLIRVFDELGIEHAVINIPASGSNYFNSLTGNASVAFTTIGESIYIGNKNEVIGNLDIEELISGYYILEVRTANDIIKKTVIIK